MGWQLNPEMQMPVLVIHGDSDNSILPNYLQGTGQWAPDAIVRVLPNCSHWIQQDAPDDVNRLLRLFIRQPSIVL
jgi:epoxide hydrolase 4